MLPAPLRGFLKQGVAAFLALKRQALCLCPFGASRDVEMGWALVLGTGALLTFRNPVRTTGIEGWKSLKRRDHRLAARSARGWKEVEAALKRPPGSWGPPLGSGSQTAAASASLSEAGGRPATPGGSLAGPGGKPAAHHGKRADPGGRFAGRSDSSLPPENRRATRSTRPAGSSGTPAPPERSIRLGSGPSATALPLFVGHSPLFARLRPLFIRYPPPFVRSRPLVGGSRRSFPQADQERGGLNEERGVTR